MVVDKPHCQKTIDYKKYKKTIAQMKNTKTSSMSEIKYTGNGILSLVETFLMTIPIKIVWHFNTGKEKRLKKDMSCFRSLKKEIVCWGLGLPRCDPRYIVELSNKTTIWVFLTKNTTGVGDEPLAFWSLLLVTIYITKYKQRCNRHNLVICVPLPKGLEVRQKVFRERSWKVYGSQL